MNLLEMYFKGGVIMYPILLCSIIMVYIAIERLLVLRKAQVDVGQFMMKPSNSLAASRTICGPSAAR